MIKYLLALLLIGTVFMTGVAATRAVTQVAVTDRTPAALQAVLPKAYEQVLIKLSGNPAVLSLPALQHSAAEITPMVQAYQYWYTRGPHSSLSVSLVFNQKQLIDLLAKAHQSVFMTDRPKTLVFVTAGSSDVVDALKQRARQYGLPVYFPVMDLVDQQNVDVTTQVPSTAVERAFFIKKYHPGALMVLSFTPRADGVHSQWQLFEDTQQTDWQINDRTVSKTVQHGLGQLLAHYAQASATMVSDCLQGQITLYIDGVKTLRDYQSLYHTLAALTAVRHIHVLSVDADHIACDVVVLGGREEFSALLQKVPQLKASERKYSDQPDVMAYHWQA